MDALSHFGGHYDEWNERRIQFLINRFGSDWFNGKRVLELGCGHAAIGRYLTGLGAHVVAVDGRPEHLEYARELCPKLETIRADLNHEWPLEGKFDLIINVGLLYHLEDPDRLLRNCFASTDQMVLETEVLDALEPKVLHVEEDCSGYDQSLTGVGIRPTASYLEQAFERHGFYAFRLTTSECNTSDERHQRHIYDWPVGGTDTWQHGYRRLWLLRRKSTMPAPEPRQMSVVVQGPVMGAGAAKPRHRLTERCVNGIRRHLPEAEIILSTWEGMDVGGLDVDDVILSEDPGATMCDDVYQIKNNINRQIVSSHAGLQRAGRPYCLKVRSDLELKSNDFLTYFGKFPSRQYAYKFTAERILTSTIFSRRFAGAGQAVTPTPFHPGDFLFFGFTEDLTSLFDVPLCSEPETSRWFETRPRPEGVFDFYEHSHCRYFPEQFLWLSFLRKFMDVPWEHRLDLNNPCLVHDRPSQVNNLVMLDQSQWYYLLPKYQLRQYAMADYDWRGLYRHSIWRKDYRALCGGNPRSWSTYDSSMRRLFHDNPPARILHRHTPKVFGYMQKKIRKQKLFR